MILAFVGGVVAGYAWQERKLVALRLELHVSEANREREQGLGGALRARVAELERTRDEIRAESAALREELEARLARLEQLASELAGKYKNAQQSPRTTEEP